MLVKVLLFIQTMSALTAPFLLLLFHDQKFKTTMSLARISIIMMMICWSTISVINIITCMIFWEYLKERFYARGIDDLIYLWTSRTLGVISLTPIMLFFCSIIGFIMGRLYWKRQEKWKIQNKIHAQYMYSLQPYEIESSIRV